MTYTKTLGCRTSFAIAAAAFAVLMFVPAQHTQADDNGVVHKTVDYTHDGVELRGHLYSPANLAADASVPGILVVHEWWGITDHPRNMAAKLAQMGYVAFVLDMYGKGKVTDDPKQAGQWAGAMYGKPIMRQRARAGLDVLAKQAHVDTDRLAAIGFCFGGTTVLQLAYDGAPVKGVVSFHGNPLPPGEADMNRIKARILVCHGQEDPMVKPEQITAFKDAMDKADANYIWASYPGAVHSFTNPGASEHGIDGVAYDAKAATQSWQDMKGFFAGLFEH